LLTLDCPDFPSTDYENRRNDAHFQQHKEMNRPILAT
jgi:hypothetical protein